MMSKEQECLSENNDDLDPSEGADQDCASDGTSYEEQTQRQIATAETVTSASYALVVIQVAESVSVPTCASHEREWQLREGAVALYNDIAPTDALESILARTAVGLSNGIMDCLGRAARNEDCLKGRDLNLRHAVKGSSALVDVIKALENHRGEGRQNVTVGQVNVQSGGQAIVGNVGPREREQAVEPIAAPIFSAPERDDEE